MNNNNFPPFLDSSATSDVPRQPQSSGSGGPQANGLCCGASNMINALQQPGHQMDLKYLFNVVEQLSTQLADNRAQTATIINGMQQIQARAEQEGSQPTASQVNGELNANRAAEVANLHAQITASQRNINRLTSQNASLRGLINEWEDSMELVLQKLRPFAYCHTQDVINLHSYYNGLLEAERQTNVNLRLENQNWQAGLGRVAHYARMALRHHNEFTLPYVRRIAGLKQENRVLRSLQGWEPPSGESDDEVDTQLSEEDEGNS